jgi:ribosome-associated toxin RatA of RatAB toxin-antitoxin module
MGTITRTVIVNATLDRVWEVVSHVGSVQQWHPLVKRAPVLSPEPTGVGAQRRCEFHDGTSVVETVTASKDREMVQVELSEFSMPLTRATGTFRFKELGPEQVEIAMTFDYDMKYGPVGWLMDTAMMKPMMNKVFGQVLAGLDQHLVTGDLIEDVGSLRAAA